MTGRVNRYWKAHAMFESVFAILWLVSVMLLLIVVLRRALRVALQVWFLFEPRSARCHWRSVV